MHMVITSFHSLFLFINCLSNEVSFYSTQYREPATEALETVLRTVIQESNKCKALAMMQKGKALVEDARRLSKEEELKSGGDWLQHGQEKRTLMRMDVTLSGVVLLHIRTTQEMIHRKTQKTKTSEAFEYLQQVQVVDSKQLIHAFKMTLAKLREGPVLGSQQQQNNQQEQQDGGGTKRKK